MDSPASRESRSPTRTSGAPEWSRSAFSPPITVDFTVTWPSCNSKSGETFLHFTDVILDRTCRLLLNAGHLIQTIASCNYHKSLWRRRTNIDDVECFQGFIECYCCPIFLLPIRFAIFVIVIECHRHYLQTNHPPDHHRRRHRAATSWSIPTTTSSWSSSGTTTALSWGTPRPCWSVGRQRRGTDGWRPRCSSPATLSIPSQTSSSSTDRASSPYGRWHFWGKGFCSIRPLRSESSATEVGRRSRLGVVALFESGYVISMQMLSGDVDRLLGVLWSGVA